MPRLYQDIIKLNQLNVTKPVSSPYTKLKIQSESEHFEEILVDDCSVDSKSRKTIKKSIDSGVEEQKAQKIKVAPKFRVFNRKSQFFNSNK